MMRIPFSYIWRSLWARRLTTALTVGNVSIRGVSPRALELRPGVHIVQGRRFQFGTHEVVVGKGIATLFKGVALGAELAFGGDRWTVVGIADAGGTAFDSEIWGDADQFMQAFGRPVYSSLTFRLAQRGGFDQLKARLQADPRMQYVALTHERDYYQEQSKTLATFIRTLGIVVTTVFSFGARVGAMITMYAAVANGTVEVGTRRALGFRRRSVLGAFLVESVMLALVGGALGVALAALLSFERISVVNFQSFSEIGFGFALSPGVIVRALVFAVVMGVVGGFLPAARAARLNIVNALRAS